MIKQEELKKIAQWRIGADGLYIRGHWINYVYDLAYAFGMTGISQEALRKRIDSIRDKLGEMKQIPSNDPLTDDPLRPEQRKHIKNVLTQADGIMKERYNPRRLDTARLDIAS